MTATAHPENKRRWFVLALIGLAQLMVVLDATIVNIALPSAQQALGFTDDARQWIVTAYALSFGSLLLLGGRLGDLWGRKRVFVIGLVGFAAASALGGFAQSFAMLVVARAMQGAFAALLAPAALGLLTTTFTVPTERNRAFAVFGGIAGSGAAVGLILGGALTEYLDWRWVMFVNLVLAIPAVVGALVLLRKETVVAGRPRIDVPGALSASAGLFAIVYGFSNAETHGWAAPLTIASLAAGVALLTAFVAIERRVEHPLLPLRVVADRARGGSFLAVAIVGAGMFGVFLFLTYYLQQTLGFSPLKTGLAFLPMMGALIPTAAIGQTRLVPRFGARRLVTFGMALGALAMLILTGVTVDSAYTSHVLPGLLVMGLGLGLVMAPAMSTATLGVDPRDAGVASAMVNTGQQIGGSIGTALLSTLASSAATSYATNHRAAGVAAQAAVHGYTTAFTWSAAIFALGALASWLLLPRSVPQADTDPAAQPVFAH
ncbi:MAG: MFS transporter [Actinobacteria bacterium]|nr:MAG: MFS transporter [Actinomycetota bacterium]